MFTILVGLGNNFVRHPLLDAHAGRLLDKIVEGLEMLDVDRRDHIDAGAQKVLDIFISFPVRAIGRIRMGQRGRHGSGRSRSCR